MTALPRPPLTRRGFLGRVSLLAAAAWPLRGELRSGPRRPDILLISADGLSPTDLGCFGGRTHTPNLDTLASHGVRLTDFHACSPVRGPSHLGLLNGRDPRRLSPKAALAESHGGGNEATPLLPRQLRLAGYHVGRSAAESVALSRILVTPGAAVSSASPSPASEAELASFNESLADRAADFILDRGNSPYFLDLHFAAALVEPAPPSSRRSDRLSRLDATIGRVLAAGRERSDPLTVFLANCGPWEEELPAPWRGGRGSLWEGGHRVPAIVAWKGRIPGGIVFPHLTSNLDLCPTLLAATGIRSESVKFDGLDLLPHFRQASAPPERVLCWSYSGSRAARRGPWKYLLNRGPGPQGPQLFELNHDPAECENRFRENSRLAARMTADLRTWESGMPT